MREEQFLGKKIVSQLSYPYNLNTKQDLILLFFKHLTNDSTLVMAENIIAII